jgi:hypothetical protein
MADPTTANFTDWRTRYAAPPLRQNLLNSQADSAGVMEAIQNMPYVFDPRKFLGQPGQFSQIGQTQGQIGQAIHPTQVPAAAATAIQSGDVQGLLQMLGPSYLPLLSGIFSPPSRG